MAELRTQKTKASVTKFIAAVENETRRKDAKVVDRMLREITGERPAMWGPSIIGYGEYNIPSGTWPRACFSPRKANLVIYLARDLKDAPLFRKLGKHKSGVSCLYINKLADVDAAVLRNLMQRSWERMGEKYAAAKRREGPNTNDERRTTK